MSRKTIYNDSRLTVITGIDHALGMFYQIYDKEFVNDTPEGEGIVLDWSELFGFESNFTGLPTSMSVEEIITKYIADNKSYQYNS